LNDLGQSAGRSVVAADRRHLRSEQVESNGLYIRFSKGPSVPAAAQLVLYMMDPNVRFVGVIPYQEDTAKAVAKLKKLAAQRLRWE
jgi:hypothetical protein